MLLYHQPRSRSGRVLWALEEAGATYDVRVIERSFKQDPEYRKLHPLGRAPVIVDDEGPIFESAAILFQIADLHPASALLAPVGTHARALQYQWSFFAGLEVEAPLMEIARQLWNEGSDPIAAVIDAAKGRLDAAVEVLAQHLDGHPFLVGDAFSVADLLIAGVLGFSRIAEIAPLDERLVGYVDAIEARPARQRALAVS